MRHWAALAQRDRHRHTLLLSGSGAWPAEWALALCAREAQAGSSEVGAGLGEVGVWLSEAAPAQLPARWLHLPFQRSSALLGREFDRIVFDLRGRFDPLTLGALSGALRAGGLLLILLPPEGLWLRGGAAGAGLRVHGWPHKRLGWRMATRLWRLWTHSACVHWFCEGPEFGRPPFASKSEHIRAERRRDIESAAPAAPAAPQPLTAGQARAVAALVRVGRGRARRPLLLTSDRGRGKSTALGLAAAELIAQHGLRVALTAPSPEAARPVLDWAARALCLPAAWPLTAPAGALIYLSPGELLQRAHEVDVLFVDEAATLPVATLAALLRRYPRAAFASTVHGYEGSGRGFQLRFRALLHEHAPHHRSVVLTEPIRYAADDPLEAWVFRALCLDTTAETWTDPPADLPATSRLCVLDRDALARDEPLLRALFGLLLHAHYRTNPGDLFRLLDAPNLRVLAAFEETRLAGAALVAVEGGLDASLSAAIFEGRRRPQGHMLPEVLSAHMGLEAAPTLRGLRIIRIAVHPDRRGRGVGRALVAQARVQAQADAAHWIGSSFGLAEGLPAFWAACGLGPVRVGLLAGRSSGHPSAVVLQGLSVEGQTLAAQAQAHFWAQLPFALSEALREEAPALLVELLRAAGARPAPGEEDLRGAAMVAYGGRPVSSAWAGAWALAVWGLGQGVALAEPQRAVLVRRLLQRWSWAQVIAEGQWTGLGEAQRLLREALAGCVAAHPSALAGALRARFSRPDEAASVRAALEV